MQMNQYDREALMNLTNAIKKSTAARVVSNMQVERQQARDEQIKVNAKEAAVRCLMFTAGVDRKTVIEEMCWRDLEEIIVEEMK